MYFSDVPRAEWPPAVDVRPTEHPEESFVGISSESRNSDVDHMARPPIIGEILGETGSSGRADPEEEENGDCRSPQTGRYITGWRPDHSSAEGRGNRVV